MYATSASRTWSFSLFQIEEFVASHRKITVIKPQGRVLPVMVSTAALHQPRIFDKTAAHARTSARQTRWCDKSHITVAPKSDAAIFDMFRRTPTARKLCVVILVPAFPTGTISKQVLPWFAASVRCFFCAVASWALLCSNASVP